MSVAAAQQQLQASPRGERIEVGPYLSKLGKTLAQSMIGDSRPVSLEVVSNGEKVSSSDAISIGLIVTERVINALKHAFSEGKEDGRIVVSYEVNGTDWKLSISDNGMGRPNDGQAAKASLGTSIVNALAEQLEARVDTVSDQNGTTVSIVHTNGATDISSSSGEGSRA